MTTSTAARRGFSRSTSSGWSSAELLASSVSTAVICSAYGRDSCTRARAFTIREVAISSMARVIFLMDCVERMRLRRTRICAAMASSVLLADLDGLLVDVVFVHRVDRRSR